MMGQKIFDLHFIYVRVNPIYVQDSPPLQEEQFAMISQMPFAENINKMSVTPYAKSPMKMLNSNAMKNKNENIMK